MRQEVKVSVRVPFPQPIMGGSFPKKVITQWKEDFFYKFGVEITPTYLRGLPEDMDYLFSQLDTIPVSNFKAALCSAKDKWDNGDISYI